MPWGTGAAASRGAGGRRSRASMLSSSECAILPNERPAAASLAFSALKSRRPNPPFSIGSCSLGSSVGSSSLPVLDLMLGARLT